MDHGQERVTDAARGEITGTDPLYDSPGANERRFHLLSLSPTAGGNYMESVLVDAPLQHPSPLL